MRFQDAILYKVLMGWCASIGTTSLVTTVVTTTLAKFVRELQCENKIVNELLYHNMADRMRILVSLIWGNNMNLLLKLNFSLRAYNLGRGY